MKSVKDNVYNGIINIYKERNYTSHDVVAKLRGILKQKKIGHTGTLDPNAEGVLPICLGKATKLCDMLTDKNKTYETVMLLGTVTDTQDTTGKIISHVEDISNISIEQIRDTVIGFQGEYNQIPPMYSALKVNGKKLYELARAGQVIERKARLVNIIAIDIIDISDDKKRVRMSVKCSKGTYIRTLCDDIGNKLGCGACMEELTRTKVSCFEAVDAIRIDDVRELVENNSIEEYIVPIDKLLMNYPRIDVLQEAMKGLNNGNILTNEYVKVSYDNTTAEQINDWYRVYDTDGSFCAIYEKNNETQEYKPVKMFL